MYEVILVIVIFTKEVILRVLIIGDGSAGHRHARILGSKGHHVEMVGADRASPIEHPDCSAVVIASPPETHKLYLHWYSDKSHILCEGPITYLPTKNNNFVRSVASNWRWVPQIQAVKTKINHLHAIHSNHWFDYDLVKWRPDIDYRTTCYYTSGIDLINLHSVDLAFYFFGPASEVHVVKQSTGKSLGTDVVGMLIKHANGTISTVNSSWHAANFQFGFKMVMEDGSYEEASWTSPKHDSIANTSYEAMIDHWLHHIENNDPLVEPSLEDGYRAYKALQGECV